MNWALPEYCEEIPKCTFYWPLSDSTRTDLPCPNNRQLPETVGELGTLPDEILVEIFRFIAPRDNLLHFPDMFNALADNLNILSCVCKRWRDLIKHEVKPYENYVSWGLIEVALCMTRKRDPCSNYTLARSNPHFYTPFTKQRPDFLQCEPDPLREYYVDVDEISRQKDGCYTAVSTRDEEFFYYHGKDVQVVEVDKIHVQDWPTPIVVKTSYIQNQQGKAYTFYSQTEKAQKLLNPHNIFPRTHFYSIFHSGRDINKLKLRFRCKNPRCRYNPYDLLLVYDMATGQIIKKDYQIFKYKYQKRYRNLKSFEQKEQIMAEVKADLTKNFKMYDFCKEIYPQLKTIKNDIYLGILAKIMNFKNLGTVEMSPYVLHFYFL